MLSNGLAGNGSALAMWRYSVIRQTEPLLGKVNEDENIFVAPPYSQTACCAFGFSFDSFNLNLKLKLSQVFLTERMV